MAHDRRSPSHSSTSQPRTRMATGYALSQSSPHSSIQEWLQQVRPSALPPTPTVVTSQAVSKLPIGATASVLAPQRSRSSRHSHGGTRYSRHSSRPSVAMEVLDFTSKVTDNLLRVAESFRIDAANREKAQKHEALVREQCQCQYAERQRQQAEEKEKILRQEANEWEQTLAREALEWEQEAAKREQNLLKYAALCEERMQKEAQAQRSNAFAREEVLLHTCLLYTSPSPRDRTRYRMPSSA